MRSSVAFAPLLAGLSYALPQGGSSCETVTSEVIVPTSTYTFLSTYVTTEHATTAKDLGVFTLVTRVPSTKTLATLTSISTDCTASGTVTARLSSTVYTVSGAEPTSSAASSLGHYLNRRQDACTVTSFFSTTYGVTETYIPANKTSTYTDYTAFTQATVTTTSYGGTEYAIATETATYYAVCGPTLNSTAPAVTTTQDARCAPTALVSAAGGSNGSAGYGLNYLDNTTGGGATYTTSSSDASACCQLCVEADGCASSAWDIRSKQCRLEFPVDFNSGQMSCGSGLLAFYDYGPNHPMAPGTGWWIGTGCGHADYAAAKPDDGSK